MDKFNFKNFEYQWLVILAASFLCVLPFILFGLPAGSEDLEHHVRLANNYFNSLQQGIFVPNWAGEENFGKGSIVVRFYPPLLEFVMAFFRIVFGNWQTAFIASFFLWSCLGGCGIYLFTKEIFKNRWQPSIAAVLFILSHYHVSQLYITYLYAEFVALSILPFCLFYAKKICEGDKIFDVLKFGVSVALLILSNLPMTIIGAICVGLFVLFLLEKESFFRQIGGLFGGCLIALLLSSFYWLRILFEVKWLNIYQPNTDPLYDFSNNFLAINFELDERGIWFVTGLYVLLVAFLVVSLIVSGKITHLFEDKIIRAIFVIFVISSILMFSISTPIWENLTFLQRVQFPRRFFSIASICAFVLIAFCFGFIERKNWNAKRPMILILIGMSFIYCFISVRQIASGANFVEGKQFEILFDQLKTSEVLKHWQPVWATNHGLKRKNAFTANGRIVENRAWENENRKFFVHQGEKSKAEIAVLYYPHWQAFVNGAKIPIDKAEDGTMLIDLPEESCEVELQFIEPQSSLMSRKISHSALCLLLFLLIYGRYRKT